MLAFAILAPFFFLHKHSSKKMPLASSSLVGHNLGRLGWYFLKTTDALTQKLAQYYLRL